MSASAAIIAGEIIVAVIAGVSEYLRAAGVEATEIKRVIDESVERVKKKDPNLLPPV